MARGILALAVLVCFVVSLTGCASARKKKELEIKGLKNQVSFLEAQVQSRDEEINNLRSTLEAEKEAAIRAAASLTPEVKSRPNSIQIQTALKNAGLYAGNIDGRTGKQTKEAIMAFQKANNLPVDGKVGKKTWNILKDYLEQKVK